MQAPRSMTHAGSMRAPLAHAGDRRLLVGPPRPAPLKARSRRSIRVQASLAARWCLDARYGCKTAATALLQEWVEKVGAKAGLNASNVRLFSGSIGVAESRLEVGCMGVDLTTCASTPGASPAPAPHTQWPRAPTLADGGALPELG